MANMPLSASQAYQQSANAFKAANWTNGTANGLTPAQNQAAVINQPGNTVNKATPQMQGILGQAAKDTAQQPPSGGFVPVGTLGATPNTGGQMPPSSGGNAAPKPDIAGIAASKIAAQRAALAGSVAAYDTSRTAAYKYAQGTTQGNRALLQFDNSNRGDQFGGSAREDLFRLQRSQGIEDTAANQAYQNDISASDAKLAAFDAGAPGMQQDIQNQLEQQQFQNNISQAPYTGQFNGQQTQQAQAQGFNQNLQTDQFNNQAQNQQFNQNLQTTQQNQSAQNQQFNQNLDQQKLQQAGQQFAAQNKLDWTKLTNDQQNQLSQIAISQQNSNISQQNANTSATNSNNSQSNVQADNARADSVANAKNYQDTFSNLQSLYTAKDPYTGAISVTNPQQLRAAILAKNFDDQTTIKMLSDFGLPIH